MKKIIKKKKEDRIIMYSTAGILILLTLFFALLIYDKSLDDEISQFSSEQIANIVDTGKETASASSSIGRSIEEEERKQKEENAGEKNKTIVETISSTSSNDKNQKTKNTNITANKTNYTKTSAKSSSTVNSNNNNENNKSKEGTNKIAKDTDKKTKKELSFQKPVEGETIREFSKDNLIFSETLQEWVTHNGIDIKADKTAIVKAAEEGKIKTIKNDPRYGLTIVIEHSDGFETVYANLLSSEFVQEGEEVKKGQSIGTVGNTAAFESSDEPHLHFEVLKDSIQVNPNIYLK